MPSGEMMQVHDRDEKSKIWSVVALLVPAILLFLVPFILPFARRAGPLLFSVAAVLSLACIIRGPKNKPAFLNLDFLGLCFGGFFLWAAVTLFWSPWFERGVFSLLATVQIALAAFVVFKFTSKQCSTSTAYLIASIGVLLASIVIFLDLQAGGPLLKLINSRPDPFRYNMVLVSLLPLGVILIPERLKTPWFYLRLLALACFSTAIFVSESETAKVTLLILFATFASSFLLPQKLVYMMMVTAVIFAWATAPWLADIMVHSKAFLGTLWDQGHAAERLAIWSGFGEMARAGLPWGWGIDASPAASQTVFFQQASVETQRNVSWLHPHSMPLQIYVEMGLPGVILAGFASLLALPRCDRISRGLWAQRCALVAVVLTVGMISHGFWQTWWWVGVAIGCYGCRFSSLEGSA
jgi:O-antigen ligase